MQFINIESPLGCRLYVKTKGNYSLASFCIWLRFLDLPDEAKQQVEGTKDNFAYALGWSHEDVGGKSHLQLPFLSMPLRLHNLPHNC